MKIFLLYILVFICSLATKERQVTIVVRIEDSSTIHFYDMEIGANVIYNISEQKGGTYFAANDSSELVLTSDKFNRAMWLYKTNPEASYNLKINNVIEYNN